MRWITLDRNDAELFDREITPESYMYLQSHMEAFKQMWNDQGPEFWIRFVISFRSRIREKITSKEDTEAFFDHRQGITAILDYGFILLERNFINSGFGTAKTLLSHIVFVEGNKHFIANIGMKPISNDPFYVKDLREAFRFLFGEPGEKHTKIKTIITQHMYVNFGGAICELLQRWIHSFDITLYRFYKEYSSEPYWTFPKEWCHNNIFEKHLIKVDQMLWLYPGKNELNHLVQQCPDKDNDFLKLRQKLSLHRSSCGTSLGSSDIVDTLEAIFRASKYTFSEKQHMKSCILCKYVESSEEGKGLGDQLHLDGTKFKPSNRMKLYKKAQSKFFKELNDLKKEEISDNPTPHNCVEKNPPSEVPSKNTRRKKKRKHKGSQHTTTIEESIHLRIKCETKIGPFPMENTEEQDLASSDEDSNNEEAARQMELLMHLLRIGPDFKSKEKEVTPDSPSTNANTSKTTKKVLNQCAYCQKKEETEKSFKKCARCKDENLKPRYYCSKTCQVEDWEEFHRKEHEGVKKKISS